MKTKQSEVSAGLTGNSINKGAAKTSIGEVSAESKKDLIDNSVPKKYTNKILLTLITVIILLALSIPLFFWLFKDRLFLNIKSDAYHAQTSTQYLNYIGFNAIDIQGVWQVKVIPGNFAIELDNKQYAKYLDLSGNVLKLGNTLSSNNDQNAKIIIHLPEITDLNISGQSKVLVSGFRQKIPALLNLDLSGTSSLAIEDSIYKNIHIDMSGASNLSFKNSQLELANINASGVSKLELNTFTNGKLSGNVSGVTLIGYSGTLISNTIESSGVVNIHHQ